MSKLKKPTIEGFIERLLEEENINTNEARDVQDLLEQSSKGMEKEDIYKLVTTLSDKLDASTNELITPNGLNLAGLDSIVKEITGVIQKDQTRRKENQTETTVDPLQEKQNIEKNPQEKEEIERQRRIEENGIYIDDLLNRIPGISSKDVPKEDKDVLAEEMENISAFYKYLQELTKSMPEAEAKKIACKKYNMTEEKLNSKTAKLARMAVVEKEMQEACKGCTTPEESKKARENYKAENKMLCDDVDPGFLKPLVEKGQTVVELLAQAFNEFQEERKLKKEEKKEEKKDKKAADVKAVTYSDNLDIEKLIKNIRIQESTKRRYRNKRKQELSDAEGVKDTKRLDEFYEKIAKRYLEYNKTVSEIYEELKGTSIVKREELEFEDFLEGINKKLLSKANGDPIKEHNLNILIGIERKIRRMDLFFDAVETAKEQGAKLYDSQKGQLEKLKTDDMRAIKDATTLREQYAKGLGVEVKGKASNERKRVIRKKAEPKDPKKKLEEDITRMSNDKKQIINIAKEKGISTDEAAKIYFTENKGALQSYSVRERRILTGRDNLNKKIIEPIKTLKKIRAFTKEKNDSLIEMYKIDIEQLNKQIKDLNNGFDNPRELDSKLHELEKAKKKLKKAEEKRGKLERKSKPKTALDIIDKKVTKKEEEKIFARYLESGKSAVDIFAEIVSNGNEYGFDKDDMIRIIEEGARKYLQEGSELNSLVENERVMFDNNISLSSLKIKRENAYKKGLNDWVVSYDKQIEVLEANQHISENSNQKYKERILRRMGKKFNTVAREDGQENTEVPKTTDTSSEKTGTTVDVVQSQEEQSTLVRNGMDVGDIKVSGILPNIKAIAKKAKVTNSKVKEAVSKIIGLGKKDKEISQEDKDEKTEKSPKADNKSKNTGETR